MTAFPNDELDSAQCHGDLLVQVCGTDPGTVRSVLARLEAATRGSVRRRWAIAGFRTENSTTTDGKPRTRDLFGFREGEGNPDPRDDALMNRLVWVQTGQGEPDWAVGGTYQVVRLIRLAMPLWNTETTGEQERVFGRRKRDGAPLGQNSEDATFDYRTDPDGQIIPLDAHIRRANPRTPATEHNRILRRGYSYHRATGADGGVDAGLIFICFQQDLERGFTTVQRRLHGEALSRYILPYGGGYFFVPPAIGPYPGHGLLEVAHH